MRRHAAFLAFSLLACSQPSEVTTVDSCGDVEIPGDGIDNDCDGYSAPLLVYATARFSGEVYAVDAETGSLAWVQQIDDGAGGPAALTDVARGTDGRLFVSLLDSGVEVLSADGSTRSSLVTGKSNVHGLFFDRSAGSLLVTTGGGDIFEVDPVSGAETPIVTGLTGAPIHSVRLASGAIYTTFRAAPAHLSRYEGGVWTDVAWFPVPVSTISIARDGSLLVNANCGNWACTAGPADFGTVFRVEPWSGAVSVEARPPTEERMGGICPDATGFGFFYGDHFRTLSDWGDGAGGSGYAVTDSLARPWGCAAGLLADTDGDGFESVRFGGTDCHDGDADVHPGATERPRDGVDQDCDGVDGVDADGDGSASVASGGTDCADADAEVYYGYSGTPGCGAPQDCASILHAFPRARSGIYEIRPNGIAMTVYCEMAFAGGGWTLISNRRGEGVDDLPAFNNAESCTPPVASIGQFFSTGCGSVQAIGASDSYAMSGTDRARLTYGEYLVVQYLDGVPDVDDAYVMRTSAFNVDLFPAAAPGSPVQLAGACDIFGVDCDTADVYWLYRATDYFGSSLCNGANSATYAGNYGLCASGLAAYDAGNRFGNRSGYDETKLYNYDPPLGDRYQERIFIR